MEVGDWIGDVHFFFPKFVDTRIQLDFSFRF